MHLLLLPLLAIAGLALAHPTSLEQRDNNNVILSTLTTNSFVGSAPCSLGSASVCIGRSNLALLKFFFAGYQPTVDTLKRSTLEEGVWHPVDRSDDVELHYFRNGSVHGLRTIQGRTSKEESAQGGFVGDFYWHAPNQAAYNSFHSNSGEVQNIANLLTSYILKYNSIESCVDFGDNDGELNSGVVTYGWNNQAFKYSSQAALETRLNRDCIIGQILRDGKNVQQQNV